MRQTVLMLVALIFLADFCFAQPWNKTFFPNTPNASYASYCYDSIAGGLIALHTQSFNGVRLNRFTAQGDTIWTQIMDDAGLTIQGVYGVKRLMTGDFIISSVGYDAFLDDYALFCKYSSSGTLLI